MAFGLGGAIVGGLAGLFGGGKQKTVNVNQTTNQSQTDSTTGNQTTANYSTPNLSPIQQSMLNGIYNTSTNLLNQPTNLTGYTQSGLENINQGGQAASQAMAANLASKGQTFSPAASTAQNANTLSRIAQGNQFLSTVPLLQTQLQQTALGQAMQGFQIQPTAVSSGGTTNTAGTSNMTGTSNTTGTQTTSGNPLAGLTSGIGAALYAPGGLMSTMGGGIPGPIPGSAAAINSQSAYSPYGPGVFGG